MNVTRELPLEERRHFLRRAALAPLCLCLVAGLHVVRVWTARQTPWKGGGFGMFSTVDSEANRFLRANLVTDSAELPLAIPAGLDKSAAEQRAAPSATGLKEIASRLAAHQWRWSDDRQRRQAAAIAQRGGEAISAAALCCPRGETSFSTGPLAGQSHVLEPIPREERSGEAIEFTAVRVECWRLRFTAADDLLRAERMLTATAARQEDRP